VNKGKKTLPEWTRHYTRSPSEYKSQNLQFNYILEKAR